MARKSKWSEDDRKKLWKLVQNRTPEQDIRTQLASDKSSMTSVEFAQQLKMAMVEAGAIKQASRGKKSENIRKQYQVTAKGRLTITDFSEAAGFKPGTRFTLEKPRGKSTAWRLVQKD